MNKEKALKILSDHNKWRRGDDSYEMADPKQLGIAIDTIIEFHNPKTNKICVKGHDLEKENCVDCSEC